MFLSGLRRWACCVFSAPQWHFLAPCRRPQISVDFSGNTTSNPGLLGPVRWPDQLLLDTTTATSGGGALFENVFSSIDFTSGAGTVRSQGTPTVNRLTPVQLTAGEECVPVELCRCLRPDRVSSVAVESVSLGIKKLQ